MNSISLSGDLRAKLAGCKVGKPETIEITITPTKISDGEITATVSGVKYEAPEAADVEETPKPKKMRRAMALDKAIGAY